MKTNRKIVVFCLIFFFAITGYLVYSAICNGQNDETKTKQKGFEELVETVTEASIGVTDEPVDEPKKKSKKTEQQKENSTPISNEKKQHKNTKSDKESNKVSRKKGKKGITTQKNTKHNETSNQDKKDAIPKTESTATSEPQTTSEPVEKTEEKKAVCSLLIECESILKQNYIPDYVPTNGVILTMDNIVIEDGDTVLSVLKAECKKAGILISVNYTGYVEGIANIFEKDFGASSGWMYQVNGKYPNVSMAKYKVSREDKITLKYTCTRGDI